MNYRGRVDRTFVFQKVNGLLITDRAPSWLKSYSGEKSQMVDPPVGRPNAGVSFINDMSSHL